MEKKEEPKSRARYERLREIEHEMQAVWAEKPQDYQESDAPEMYHDKSFD